MSVVSILAECTAHRSSLENSLLFCSKHAPIIHPSVSNPVVALRQNDPYAFNVIGTPCESEDSESDCGAISSWPVGRSLLMPRLCSTPTKVHSPIANTPPLSLLSIVSQQASRMVVTKSKVSRVYHNGRPVPVLPDGTLLFTPSADL